MTVALPVQAGYVPPGLARGQVVDVYAVADPAAGASGAADGGVTLVVGAAPVQAVSGRTDGVLSSAATTVQVVVSVAADDAAGVLAAIGGRPLVVVGARLGRRRRPDGGFRSVDRRRGIERDDVGRAHLQRADAGAAGPPS